jgi:hypothetical protein
VVSLKTYIDQDRSPAFTRFNVFLRDGFTCQYCGQAGELTFDHVVPRSHGGRTTWENIVAACPPCNLRKGGRTPLQAGMPIRHAPRRPNAWQLQDAGRRFPPDYLHNSWQAFLLTQWVCDARDNVEPLDKPDAVVRALKWRGGRTSGTKRTVEPMAVAL